MKVAILAGGRGTRMGKATRRTPKPMLEIGGLPVLCHLLHYFAAYGMTSFCIALGHQGSIIRRYFSDHGNTSVIADLQIKLVDTGEDTATGGRLKRLSHDLGEQPFMLTWSDGLSDIDLHALRTFHQRHGKLATVSAVKPPSRFGYLRLLEDQVVEFKEKSAPEDHWINGAFFVLQPPVLNLIDDDATSLEYSVLPQLAASDELMAYRHHGFWQCMDTPAEYELIQRLWESGEAPWKKPDKT